MYRRSNGTHQSSLANDSNLLKAPKAPEKPLAPYMRFSRKMWAKVRADNPDSQLWDIGKIIGKIWRDLSDAEKLSYQQEYDIEKAEYERALKNYHNSAPYQQYIAARNRAKMTDKSNTIGGMIASGNRGRLESGGVVLQPAEDEDHPEYSQKKLAAIRFDRNHRLAADLFNGNVVTDSRTIIAQSRVDMLKKQAQSLTLHQAKLDDELRSYVEAFENRKRVIEKSSEEFAAKLKKVCDDKPQVDEETMENMIMVWEEKLLKAYEEYKTKQEAVRAQKMVEREQLAEETPVLYRLTVGESSPSPNAAERKVTSPIVTELRETVSDESTTVPSSSSVSSSTAALESSST